MRTLLRVAIPFALIIEGTGLAGSSASLTVAVRLAGDGGCVATVEGKSFDVKDQAALEAALAPFEDRIPEARIIGDMDTPYRCIGGLIYALQAKGFSKIGFISEPEPNRNEPVQ